MSNYPPPPPPPVPPSSAPPPPPAPAPAPTPPGRGQSRISRTTLIAVFAGLLAGILVITLIVVKLRAPGPPVAPCEGALCPVPKGPAGLVSLTHWRSDALGYTVGFDSSDWHPIAQDARSLVLEHASGAMTFWVEGADARQATPAQLFHHRLSELQDKISSLATDSTPENRILGPHIGFVPGIAGTYGGTDNETSRQEWIYVIAAGDPKASLVVSVLTTDPDYKERKDILLSTADEVLNEIYFPSVAGG